MAEAIHEDGFALIPGVLSQEEIQAAKDKIDALEPFGFDSQGVTDHYKCVFNRSFLARFPRPSRRGRPRRGDDGLGVPHHRPDGLAEPSRA